MEDVLLYFAFLYQGDYMSIWQALQNYESIDWQELAQMKKQLTNNSIKYVSALDRQYPEVLINTVNPPFVLFYKGNFELLKNKINALASDVDSWENMQIVAEIATNPQKETFISGNWKGADAKINKHLNASGHHLIYIAAHGLAAPYLLKGDINWKQNLLISQYPPLSKAKLRRFLERNYLIAQLAQKLILLHFYKNSKVLNLVTMFLELGKNIYVFQSPQRAWLGNQDLIAEGAIAITKYKDIMQKS